MLLPMYVEFVAKFTAFKLVGMAEVAEVVKSLKMQKVVKTLYQQKF